MFVLVNVNKDDFFQLNNASTSGHPYKLYKVTNPLATAEQGRPSLALEH